jgi:CIC family chloride channel protein
MTETGRPLADFTTDPRGLLRMAALAVGVGALAGGAAFVLLRLIGLITNLAYFGRWSTALTAPAIHGGAWPLMAVPVAGGAVVGLIARYGSEQVRGHGIPEAIESILVHKSRMSPRVALFKPLASAITIGTGGPFGAEGPIIMTGGAVASLVGQWLSLTAAERRTLLVAGAAGGMSATFGAPVSAVLLAVELLLFEWKPRSFVPVALASTAAYAVRVVAIGSAVVFRSPMAPPPHLSWLLGALGLGVVCGGISGLLTKAVYWVEDAYRRLPVHWMWWPAIGGLAVGVGGLMVPAALGVGYPTIRALDGGHVLVAFAAGLFLVKLGMWVLSLSSGTSGGVLAPLLMMGGAVGTALSPLLPPDQSLAATIGMAALLAATMRAPFTATVFAMETTHDWNALGPVFVACMAGTAVTVVWMRRSILTEKVARRGTHVAREYAVDPLEGVSVADLMTPVPLASTGAAASHGMAPPTIPQDRRARDAALLMARHGAPALWAVDDEGRVVGRITPSHFLAVWAAVTDDEQRRERGFGPRSRPPAVDPVGSADNQ